MTISDHETVNLNNDVDLIDLSDQSSVNVQSDEVNTLIISPQSESSMLLDLTEEEYNFINDTDNRGNDSTNRTLPGSSIENSIVLDDDTFAFFIEAGLENPEELSQLGINIDEIKAQRSLVERLERENQRNAEIAQQLQSQYAFDLSSSSSETSSSVITSQISSPSAFSQSIMPRPETVAGPSSKRGLESTREESINKRQKTLKGKEPIEIPDDVDLIDLTKDDDALPIRLTYSDLHHSNLIYDSDEDNNDDEEEDARLVDYLSHVPWTTREFNNSRGHFRMTTNNNIPFPLDIQSTHMASIASQYYSIQNRKNIYVPPEEIEKELRELLENISDDDPPPQDRAGTPNGLSINLMEHQKIGLQWMIKMENSSNKGGILADDMGLGKTIQALATIVERPCPNPTVVPASKIGSKRITVVEGELLVKATLIVCPVSLMDQWRREIEQKTNPKLKVLVFHGANRTNNPYDFAQYDVIISSYAVTATNFHENCKGPISKVKFHRIILDEAHTIKNRNTLSARGCCQVEATYRWCMTANPIQNKIEELYSLIKFLRIRPFCEWEEFRDTILKPMKSGNHHKAIKVTSVLMKAIALRRSKKAMVDGRPILDLPARNIHMTHIDFSPDERIHYDFVDKRAQARLNRYIQSGTVMKNYSSVLVLLLRLRQACLHPSLTLTEGDPGIAVNEDTQIQVAKKMKPEVVERLLRPDNPINSVECPICMDTAENAMILKGCGHILCRECLDNFLTVEVDVDKRCPHCRGEMNKQSAIPVEVFVKVHAPHLLKEAEDDLDEEAEEKKAEAKVKEFISSAKIDKMLQILDQTATNTNGEDKTIIFSQFTAFLDLLDKPLKDRGHKYLRYDGSMDIKHRAETVNKFFEDPQYKVLLVSTKCGSLGLNLTCANRVILMDVWWNPALENQAIDRVHRIGQTKAVDVHRIFINNTVEDRILELQNKKQQIADGVFGEGSIGQSGRLRLEEMIYLLRGGPLPSSLETNVNGEGSSRTSNVQEYSF
ncbi:SNF2 family N-terminal domain-containing protein [Cokeromyces recurvatus]|uniref:SNF2 family N-terminal domain-containing protein n=1 Tax=Cokeromyces recurvatus TaxID=90255 RepID=UPI00221EDF02|nr:SNF2 family N-terminal domain-containing protein [Cokeromyces recurvatus]KAI7904060.1 SNF2 family N-terminal domain-containing protein [Cokeromyces recurvatus]